MATIDAESPCPKCGGLRIRYERAKGGYTDPKCRPCASAAMRARYQADPEAGSERTKAYYQANAEKVKAKARVAYRNDPEKHRARTREWYEANAERAKLYAKDRYDADPAASLARSKAWSQANPERHAELKRQWRDANRKRIKAYNADYYAKNRESEIARCLAYVKAHPEVDAAIKQRREARKRDVVCEHGLKCVTSAFMKMIRESGCLYCGGSGPGHADHFVPLSRAGLHCVENIVPACVHCNTSKHAMDPYDWLAGLQRPAA